MSFVYEPNTYHLVFGPNDPLHGLEVTVQSVPLGKFLQITQHAGDASSKDSVKVVGAVSALFDALGSAIVSWNLTAKDGTAIPCTVESLQEQPTELAMRLVQEWMQAIGGVSPDLGKDSDSGVTYPAVPLTAA